MQQICIPRVARRWTRQGSVAAACLVVSAFAPWASSSADELAQYVSKPDSSYAWREVSSGRSGSTDYVELILTSQTWREVSWKHQLFVFRPKRTDAATKQAFLFIDGGRWRPEYESGLKDGLPREARVFTRLADAIHAPVAVVRQVPFEPLFERREDALIAYTFDQYLVTGEPDWPLLLPMVKSAARAMDAVQELARQRWQIPIEQFTVTGASKRGWTSWLVAAVDPRVASVAPMVIDMLNIPAQIGLQRATFGGLSEQIQDYADINLPDRIDTDRGRELLSMVDPYSYRASLTQPKLILLGTNDPYWPLDALKLYWDNLPQPKRVLYLPNQKHGLHDVDRLIGSLSALHRYSARAAALPQVSWKFAPRSDRLELTVQTDRRPRRVLAWTATSPTRDFRSAQWTHHRCRRSHREFVCTQPVASDRYTAMYSEAAFKDRGAPTFSLSTGVCIAGGPDAARPEC